MGVADVLLAREGVEAAPHAAGELGVRVEDPAVEDVDRDAAPRPEVPVGLVEGERRWSIRSSANETVCDSTYAVGSDATVLPAEATTLVCVPTPPRRRRATAEDYRGDGEGGAGGRIGGATRLDMRRRR